MASRDRARGIIEEMREIRSPIRYLEQVKWIVDKVRIDRDRGLMELTKKFDGVDLAEVGFQITRDEIESLADEAPKELIDALEKLRSNIESVEVPLIESLKKVEGKTAIDPDISIDTSIKPIDRVACYIPGGLASYPSTAVMCGTVAKITGVPEVVASVPPKGLTPAIAAALKVVGFTKVYRLGGAQAIAALAYGTESVDRVDMIAGPGGAYVSAAKYLVSNVVKIDMIAGPTEIAIIVDRDTDPYTVAFDAIAQLEHSPDTTMIIASLDDQVAHRIAESLFELARKIEARREIILEALNDGAWILSIEDRDLLVDFINMVAPEHLELCVSDERDLVNELRNYGVMLTKCTSPVITDYYAGVNHILPTSGTARWRGGLSPLDFLVVRRRVAFTGSSEELETIARHIRVLAEVEDLPNHYGAIARRLSR